MEQDGNDDQDDHDRSLRDRGLFSVRVLGEEEETAEADLLDVESNEDVREGFRVELASGLVRGRIVNYEKEEVLCGCDGVRECG